MVRHLCALFFSGVVITAAAPPCLKCTTPNPLSFVNRVPANGNRRVLILGSSTAAGSGASDISHSWASLLTTALAPRGFTVINKSISSSATQDSINRFATDVVPNHPDFVVLATSIWNEGFAADPVQLSGTFLSNTRTLISMVENIGAVPILVGVYPNFGSTPAAVSVIKNLYADFEAMGVPLWDFWNGCADPQGNWLPALSTDGTHPSDAGHLALFNAIPLSYFTAAYQVVDPAAIETSGSWLSDVATNAPGSVTIRLTSAAGSWSAATWFKCSQPVGRDPILTVGQAVQVQLLRTPEGYEVDVNGAVRITGAAPAEPAGAWHHILLTYSQTQNLISVYADGALLATRGMVDAGSPSQFTIGGGPDPCGFNHFVVSRSPLSADDAASFASFVIPRKSIEAWAKLASGDASGLINSAGTATSVSAAGTWLFDTSSQVEKCTYYRQTAPGSDAGCRTGPTRLPGGDKSAVTKPRSIHFSRGPGAHSN